MPRPNQHVRPGSQATTPGLPDVLRGERNSDVVRNNIMINLASAHQSRSHQQPTHAAFERLAESELPMVVAVLQTIQHNGC
jgi:hypothetical protein